MTDTRVSAYSAGSSPLVGTEVVAGVQSGTSVKFTTQQIANLGFSQVRATPGGRLTLVSATPILTSDQTAKTAVYYTPYVDDYVPIYGSSVWGAYAFTEQTLNLDATNHVSGSVYDVFIWSNAGVVSIGTGPAWSSTTARGTGAGTTELQMLNGLWTNKNSITLKNGAGAGTAGIAANAATYVGSIYCTANGQTGMAFKPAAAAGGTNNFLGVYNAYNRTNVVATSKDSATGGTYSTLTWRAAAGSNSNRISYLDGLGQSAVDASYQQMGSGTFWLIGINRDSTSATPDLNGGGPGTGQTMFSVRDTFLPSLGFHYLQAMESVASAGTFTNSSGPSGQYNYMQGLTVRLEM